MPRYRAIYDSKGLLAEYEGEECTFVRQDYRSPARSDLPSPSLMSDHIDPFMSMADGKLYDSKSAYRATLAARGLVELGNDAPMTLRAPVPPDPNERKRGLHKQLSDMSDKQANKLLKKLKKGDLT